MSTAEPPRLTRRTCIGTSATLLASFECGGLLSLKQGLAAQELDSGTWNVTAEAYNR